MVALFHGSNVSVEKPVLIVSKRFLDFGHGFYLTSDFEQAKKWSQRTYNIRESGKPTVSVFNISDDDYTKLNVMKFDKADEKWLRFISAHRTGNAPEDDYDVIIGPVANDQAIRTINNYLKGYFPEDVAIRLLLPQKLKDQYVFKTQKALETLIFKEAVTEWND